jgi:hypothetical protein
VTAAGTLTQARGRRTHGSCRRRNYRIATQKLQVKNREARKIRLVCASEPMKSGPRKLFRESGGQLGSCWLSIAFINSFKETHKERMIRQEKEAAERRLAREKVQQDETKATQAVVQS